MHGCKTSVVELGTSSLERGNWMARRCNLRIPEHAHAFPPAPDNRHTHPLPAHIPCQLTSPCQLVSFCQLISLASSSPLLSCLLTRLSASSSLPALWVDRFL